MRESFIYAVSICKHSRKVLSLGIYNCIGHQHYIAIRTTCVSKINIVYISVGITIHCIGYNVIHSSIIIHCMSKSCTIKASAKNRNNFPVCISTPLSVMVHLIDAYIVRSNCLKYKTIAVSQRDVRQVLTYTLTNSRSHSLNNSSVKCI